MKIKYLFVAIFSFLFINPDVYAICGKQDMLRIKEIANNVTFTVQYDKDEEGKDTGLYNIVIDGLTEELYLIDESNPEREYWYDSTNGGKLLFEDLNDGKYEYTILYKNCDPGEVRTVAMNVLKYNHYANDPLCDGIEETELDVCSRAYQGTLTDEIFKEKVEQYKKSLSLNSVSKENSDNSSNGIIDNLKRYYIYIIIGLVLITTVTIIMVVNKKRGELE